MTTAHRISCADGSLLRLENHTWGRKSLKGMRNRLLKTFITRHYIILTSILYRVRTLTHITRKNQKIARTPHILGRLNACANSVYKALLRFSRAPGMRLRIGRLLVTLYVGMAPTRNICHTSPQIR